MSAEFELPGFAQPFSRDNQRLVCKGLPYGRSKDCFSSFEVLQEVFFKERLYLFFFSLRYICTVCVSLFNRWTDLHMIKLAFYFLSGTTALKKKNCSKLGQGKHDTLQTIGYSFWYVSSKKSLWEIRYFTLFSFSRFEGDNS